MRTPRPSGSQPAHDAGSPQAWRPSTGLLAVAVAIVTTALTYFWMSPLIPSTSGSGVVFPSGQPVASTSAIAPTQTPGTMTASSAARSTTPAQPAPTPVDGVDPTPDLSSYVNRGEKPSMQEVITRLQQNNVTSGLAAFSPPGTRPPKIGLAVPENLVLPPGYVRHHQATDDGQRIEAILMFAPDYRPLDANNQPVEIPADRVVPSHLAPPGFPVRSITIPPPRPQ